MKTKDLNKFYRVIASIVLIAFIVTDAVYAAPGSGALRPPMAMGTLAKDSKASPRQILKTISTIMRDPGRLNKGSLAIAALQYCETRGLGVF